MNKVLMVFKVFIAPERGIAVQFPHPGRHRAA